MSSDQLTKMTDEALAARADFGALRVLGIRQIEQLSSAVWTDYNTHDPGITILEHACYLITDLLYRTGHRIEDLLASDPDQPDDVTDANFTAASILPCRPVTIQDYRKLLIDIPGIRNAWLTTREGYGRDMYVDCKNEVLTLLPVVPGKVVKLRGFYDVQVDVEDSVVAADHAALLAEVRATLHAHRNLCEDFLSFTVIRIEKVAVCADVEIANDADVNEVLARIIFALEQFISPQIPFHSLQEMQDRGRVMEDIFSGPLLKSGFVDDAELAAADRKAEIHVSDLIQIIMDVPGVVAIRKILLTSYQDGVPIHAGEKWVLPLAVDRATRLSVKASRFQFFKSEIPFRANEPAVEDRLEDLRAAGTIRRYTGHNFDLLPPVGRFRRLGDYFSLQNDFPLNYGIGRFGLPPTATPLRLAQAGQLKAYLLFFEQHLANYLATLANLRRVFAISTTQHVLFGQVPETVEKLDAVIGADHAKFLVKMLGLLESPSQFQRRRNTMLDQLLARFAEEFSGYALICGRLYGADASARLIEDKQRFLERLPGFSRDRAAAFNYLANPLDRWNLSGLEQRLHTLLGLDIDLVKLFQVYLESDEDGVNEYRFRMVDDAGRILLSSSTRYGNRQAAHDEIRNVVAYGRVPASYQKAVASDGRFYFNLMDPSGEVIARRIQYFDTEAERDAAIQQTMDFFERRTEEWFYVLEHILLRPRSDHPEFLPTCAKAGEAGDCACDDPYSFRISVIMPRWPERFANMYFRQFIERTIREHAPAHIYVKICWIDRAPMAAFEAAYWTWRKDLAADAPSLPDSQDALIKVWRDLRSVFPEATLHDCIQGDDDNPVVLDNTMLGTFHAEDNHDND